MKEIEAMVIDATHLELMTPLPEVAGRRLLIHVVPFRDEQERLVRELRAAYLTMTEEERQAEVVLAEEGLYGQLSPTEAFPGEDEWPWWE
ncbi:MAG: hypothetical protein FJ014_13990 [Chloroflexi bacterium]|nr:hypothetical protein [Chloroflexota bacterium]